MLSFAIWALRVVSAVPPPGQMQDKPFHLRSRGLWSVFLLFLSSPKRGNCMRTRLSSPPFLHETKPTVSTHTYYHLLLTLISGFHAGNERIALVAAVVLIRVVQGHTHALVLVPFIPDITTFNGVLDALFLCTKATRPTPAFRGERT